MKPVVVVIALMAVPVFADDVYLRGGGQITGEIVERTDESVTVDIGGGTVTARMSSIVRIEERQSPLQEYRARAETIAFDDVEGWRELARWATGWALSAQAGKAYSQVLAVLPDDPEANAALGRVRLDGNWVSEEESYLAQGYIKFEGQWMTPGESQAILKRRQAQAEADRQANEAAIREIEVEQQAEKAEKHAERDDFSHNTSAHWGWGVAPGHWPVPDKPPPTNPVDRQTGDWP